MNFARINPFLLYLPLLLFYIGWVVVFHQNKMEGDELRYVTFAQNLVNGYYSPLRQINLWNGPGYPLILVPFVALKLPLLLYTLANALFQYVGLVLFHFTLQGILTSFKKSVFITLLLGFYAPAFPQLSLILTESFCFMLICLICFLAARLQQQFSRFTCVLLGFCIGYLALTKIIFGYVLLLSIAAAVVLWLTRKTTPEKTALKVLAIALLTTAPYLLYTWHLTGKLFYWGNSGGMSLYWMSTPFENEYGDWQNETLTLYHNRLSLPAWDSTYTAQLTKNHGKELQQILSLPALEQDNAFKKTALQNIRTHPAKYLSNCVANLGRMFFDFPLSYFPHKPVFLYRVFYNSFLWVSIVLSLLLCLRSWQSIPYWLRGLLFFFSTYLALSVLVSAYPRQLNIIVPFLLLWISYIFSRKIKLNWQG